MRPVMRLAISLAAATVLAGVTAHAVAPSQRAAEGDEWDRAGAATYLDARMEIWLAEGTPLRTGSGTTNCVSCHTTLPYALSRPVLRQEMGVAAPTSQERRLLEQVIERVETYADHELLYEFSETKKVESRGTEAVLNALIVIAADGNASDEVTQRALRRLWETQRSDGAWDWLQFGLEPFETVEAVYHGSALAALAIGRAGAAATSTQPHAAAGVVGLRAYLRASYATRSLYNRTWVLLASTQLVGLLTTAQQKALIAELEQRQQDDGGWSLWSLGEWRWSGSEAPFKSPGELDDTLLAKSDGYATGLVVHALREAGASASQPAVDRGLRWLRASQGAVKVNDQTPPAWRAHSLNFDREHGGDKGEAVRRLFMSDLATAFAVLALSQSD